MVTSGMVRCQREFAGNQTREVPVMRKVDPVGFDDTRDRAKLNPGLRSSKVTQTSRNLQKVEFYNVYPVTMSQRKTYGKNLPAASLAEQLRKKLYHIRSRYRVSSICP